MKTLVIVVRRVFFFGSFALAAVALLEKLMNVFHFTLFQGNFSPYRLLEFAAIGVLFAIALQLHEIRLVLSAKSANLPK
jgi:hypothetical protein